MSTVKPPAGNRAYKRSLKNLWLNPKFQMKYVFWLSATGLVLVAVNALVFYRFVSENYAILVDLSPMTDEAKAQLYHELHSIIGLIIAFSFLFLLATSIVGVVLSHRTAGPLYKFKKVFGEIRDGRRNLRLHLRPNDDFKDVAQVFNEMMDSLEK